MIRRPPRSTHCISSAASDVYKRQLVPWLENSVLIEAEAAAIPALMAHLRRYKLRSKVTIHNHTKELAVLAICGQEAEAARAWDPEEFQGPVWTVLEVTGTLSVKRISEAVLRPPVPSTCG